MSSAQSRTIVVVDDEEIVREAAENLLRAAGFHTESFASAEDFLRAWPPAAAACDCLVLDILLPGMSGLQLQQLLTGQGMRIPVVFVTACEDAEERMRAQAIDVAAQTIVHKPFTELELLTAVHRAVGHQAYSCRSLSE